MWPIKQTLRIRNPLRRKRYLGDTGLLVSHAFDENELLEDEVYKQILDGKLGLNEGMLYENVIAQMLTANGHRLFFYTHYSEEKKRNDIEIDFIISNNSKTKYKMYSIEVNSGTRYTTDSLLKFREKYKVRIGGCYIIHPRNLIVNDDILCIPPYMTICLSFFLPTPLASFLILCCKSLCICTKSKDCVKTVTRHIKLMTLRYAGYLIYIKEPFLNGMAAARKCGRLFLRRGGGEMGNTLIFRTNSL